MPTIAQKANALVSLYIKLYAEKYGVQPTVNRYREKWAFQDMITDLGEQGAKNVVTFYFKTGRVGHPIQHLMYNYDSLYKIMLESEEDAKNREILRRETEKRIRELEAKNAE